MTERYEHPSDPSTSETPASAADTESGLGAGKGMSRRTLLKGAVAAAGIAGFPYVHAQEKITLRYLGTAVNQSSDIAKKFQEDTGIQIQYIPVTTDDVAKRIITQPNSFDIVDTEYFSLKKLIPAGTLAGMDAKKIKLADKITPVLTRGEVDGKKIGDQGTAPKKVMFLTGARSTQFSATPTEWMTLIPTTYNADTLGIRPDLIKRPINSWSELLNPEFKGKAALLNIPAIGIMDSAMAIEAMGHVKYGDKGNMTKAEIDQTIKILIEAKRAGQFRAFWKDFNESVNLMASGEVVIQSMWSPAVTKVRTMGISSRSRKVIARGRRASGCRVRCRAASSTRPTSSSTGSRTAGPARISCARVITRACSRPPRPICSRMSGITGSKASRPRRTSRRPMASCWKRSARCATAVRTTSVWAPSRAGTR